MTAKYYNLPIQQFVKCTGYCNSHISCFVFTTEVDLNILGYFRQCLNLFAFKYSPENLIKKHHNSKFAVDLTFVFLIPPSLDYLKSLLL